MPITDAKSLKLARKKAGMTQVELSERSGLSRPYLSNLENDVQPLTNYARTLCENAICVFVSARFKELPAVQALEKENKILRERLNKRIESLRDPLILRLQREIEKQATQIERLTRDLGQFKCNEILVTIPKKGK